MNRKRLRFLVFVCVLALLVGVGYKVASTVREQRLALLQHMALSLATGADQRLQHFHRVSLQEGRKAWEIAAREARYFKEQGMIVVYEPQVAFYPSQGEVVSLKGAEGQIYLKGKEIERIVFQGPLEVHFSNLRITTQEAVYERKWDRIVAQGWVEITAPGWTVRGQGCEVTIAQKQLRLTRNVRTTLAPKPG